MILFLCSGVGMAQHENYEERIPGSNTMLPMVYIQSETLIPNIEKCWDEIGYFQIGDNPGRKEPTTGEINYTNIFKYIHSRGFDGILGMEHGNSLSDKVGEQAVIDAYLKVDQFL